MNKHLSTLLSWLLGLILAVIAAIAFGKLISVIGISNSTVISITGTFAGMICSGFYRNTLKYIKSEEYRLKIKEYKNKLDAQARKEREEFKRKTIVELYLLNERKTFVKVKLLAVMMIFSGAILTYLFNFNGVIILVGAVVFTLIEVKERILTYRISKGYYGNNTTEAIQILKFIESNIDKINNDGNGSRRRILNDKVLDNTSDELLAKGGLDAR
ncbi:MULTISPECIES: hypothetical protein [Enterobacter]|uniref:hypothetical protein n=1 Tax=Enterobacter TaxID=547 RepID=UPI000799C0C0|nr:MULTISPECIES: hypothetical protein [Enterobacter]EKS6386432.1 hypothetical protein [Enterobacter hormaechei]HDW2125617.1 hypothetical protein [Enterobacter hormaechei subsp. steigerwaltii]MCK7313619.1 hypothetical protein [Enterobacter bugandensis]SAE06405.1 Uncharacterised protein [Enterobacter cloacae]HEO8957345.1 hypothetical protein [Enterobacter hormaechei subsp. steigerwaltii]